MMTRYRFVFENIIPIAIFMISLILVFRIALSSWT